MVHPLTPEVHAEVFNRIKSCFSDFHLFDSLVATKLKSAISDSNQIELNMKTAKKVAERYFDASTFKTNEQKLIWMQIQIIFKAAYVVLLTYQDHVKCLLWHDVDTLLRNYEDFENEEEDELQLLLNFRNMTRVALMLIPARLNKQLILKIAGRLEGSQNEYITGGGQKPCVTRRVTIYEQEGGVEAEKREKRNRLPPQENITGNKRRTTAFSDKKIKLVRLASDEIKQMTKGPVNPFPIALQEGLIRHSSDRNRMMLSPLSALSDAASMVLNGKDVEQGKLPTLPRPPSFGREPSDPINSFLISSDSDFWKDTLKIDSSNNAVQPALQRNMSMGIHLPEFTEGLGNIFTEPVNFGEGASSTQKPALNRGFSLGFYTGSSLSEDWKALLQPTPRE